MYIRRFVLKRNSFNSLTLFAHCFSSKSHINKVSLYFQRAKLIDSIRLALRSHDPSSLTSLLNDPALDSFVVTNALRSAPSLDSALFLTEALKAIPHFRHTQYTLYALGKILAKFQQSRKLKALVDAINSGKFPNVARVSFMDCIRWYSIAGDRDSVLSVWEKWRTSTRRPSAETFNILIGLHAHNGNETEAVKIFKMMIDEGVIPDCRTYTVLIEHLVKSEKLESAMEIFRILSLMGIQRTLRQYSLLMEAFVGAEDFKLAKSLLNEMKIDGLLPGQAMLSTLQRMHKAGFVEDTEEFIKELLPDERIQKISCPLDDDRDDNGDYDTENENGDVDDNSVQLKPWLDPSALASALQNWGPEEVSALEAAKLVWTSRLVCKMIRSFRSAETASKFFCWVAHKSGFAYDIYTLSRVIHKLAQKGYVDLVDGIFVKVKTERIRLSFITIRMVIDSYGVHKKGHAALEVFRDLETLCGPVSKSHMLVLYTSLLRTLAKCKMNSDVLDILDEMILDGISPDIQTFTGLMHHFAIQGDIKAVQRLFSMVKQSGIEPDACMFKVLIRAFCKCGRAVLALRVFEEMMNSSLMTDTATKQLLVKSLWKEGKFKEAASIEERNEEINCTSPLALRGHLYKISSDDLMRVCNIYSESFSTPKS